MAHLNRWQPRKTMQHNAPHSTRALYYTSSRQSTDESTTRMWVSTVSTVTCSELVQRTESFATAKERDSPLHGVETEELVSVRDYAKMWWRPSYEIRLIRHRDFDVCNTEGHCRTDTTGIWCFLWKWSVAKFLNARVGCAADASEAGFDYAANVVRTSFWKNFFFSKNVLGTHSLIVPLSLCVDRW
jgi:hypothetical protein